MAELLYRLGFASARRPWIAIVSWLAVLALSVGAFTAFGGALTSTITIPGTPTAQVTDRLQEEFPEAAHGSGAVVFRTTDGSALAEGQRRQVTDLLAEVEGLDGVDSVVDAFATEQELADQRARLEEGRAQLAEGRDRLDAGRAQIAAAEDRLDASEAELRAGQEQLDAARAQAEAAGAPPAATAPLDAQQAQLDAGRAQLEEGRAQLEAQRAELERGARDAESGRADLDRGEALLALAGDYRTVAQDGSTAVGTVVFDRPSTEVPEEIQQAVVSTLEGASIDGVEVLPTNALSQTIPDIVGPGEVIGLVVAAVVLVVMLGTLVTAGLPIVTALIGVGIGATASLAFSGTVEMLSVTPVLGLMLGLAVGIDYALFIVNRHRRQLKDGAPLHESIGLATGTSGNAVVFAGLTVIIALAALNVTGIPFLGLMGTVGAFCVLVAVLIAVSLTPALLGLIGHRALGRGERARLARDLEARAVERGLRRQEDLGREVASGGQLASRAAGSAGRRAPMSTGRAVVTALATAAVLGLVAVPFLSLRLGLPDGASEPQDSAAYQSYTALGRAFGEGYNGPLVVTADLPAGLDEGEVRDAQVAVGEQLAGLDHVEVVVPAAVNEDSTMMMFQVVPAEGPNAVSTGELVHELRTTDPAGGATDLAVAGMTSGSLDVADKLAAALPVYLGVVVGLSLLIMVVVFRSLVVPLIATGGFILSVFAAMGGVVAIYQWGWLSGLFGVHAPGPILAFLPTIMVGVLFGLAMDYQLFISSGMREAYAHGAPARVAVVEGLRAGRSVVAAAAIIMISVFGGFVFAESAMIRPIGFGLAFGVLLDALLVRLLLMPALMHLVGEAAWWLPRWLDRILPNVDVEGAALERDHGHGPDDGRSGPAAGSGSGYGAGAGGVGGTGRHRAEPEPARA
ncbi:RND transporter [Citricoccus sp. SGAir0253]|uniref:MMPL family transporter n=1 Tax=Citricoccus sp. SGAir0253 TaxID=2567881 RepID=UPI0010CCF034|nr:MMPL family transporter [Citricoccus sp. SGAir0253]QCU77294.1 RND transporter [Citricoccus sp. SGAir0253]